MRPAAEFELLSEDTLRETVDTMVRLVEAAGALVIFIWPSPPTGSSARFRAATLTLSSRSG